MRISVGTMPRSSNQWDFGVYNKTLRIQKRKGATNQAFVSELEEIITHLVITLIKKGRAIDPGVRDLVSDVEVISAGGGGEILPMLIIPGVNILNKWVQG